MPKFPQRNDRVSYVNYINEYKYIFPVDVLLITVHTCNP